MKRKMIIISDIESCRECELLRCKETPGYELSNVGVKHYFCPFINKRTNDFSWKEENDAVRKELEQWFKDCTKWEEIK